MRGLTGHVEFTEGRRSNFKLDLLKLKKEELRKVGQWTPSSGINITDSTAFYETTTANITLVVMTREVRSSHSSPQKKKNLLSRLSWNETVKLLDVACPY